MAESSFQRLLLRMPEDARRRFCCSALEQELLEAKNCVSDCVEAAAHAQQVREATLKLQTNSQSGTPVTSKSTPAIVVLLAEVDELQKRIEASLTVLGQPYKGLIVPKPTVATPAPTAVPKQEAKKNAAVIRDETVIETAAAVRSFVQQLQPLVSRGLTHKALDLLDHFIKSLNRDTNAIIDAASKRELETPLTQLRSGLLLLENDDDRIDKLLRLRTSLKSLVKKNLKMVDFMEETEALAVAKKKEEIKTANKKAEKRAKQKKRKLLEALAAEENEANKQASQTQNQSTETGAESATLQATDLRKILNRCTKDVKALIDRFDLAKFDLNLKRMIDVMNSISSAFTQEETATLATTLFCLVEVVEKISDGTKRKDRLVCLEGVLRIFIASKFLPLTTRQRSMAKEYLANNQQSLHVLQAPSAPPTKIPIRIAVPSQLAPASAPKKKTPVVVHMASKAKDKRTKIHVHFDE